MNDSLYKKFTVSRGFKYNYYASNPDVEPVRPTLVFVHGFGIASKDWRHLIPFFEKKGYRIIAPDLLGYGGSAMPNSPNDLKHSLMARDIVDILTNERVQKAVFIGQGGGCPIVGRIAQLHLDRTEACVFLSISYMPPTPTLDYEKMLALQERQFGYALFGYWGFIAGDEAVDTINENFEAFFNLNYPDDPTVWTTHFGPVGAMKQYLLAGRPLPSPSWFAPGDKKIQYEGLRSSDISGPLTYYKAYSSDVQTEDDEGIPPSRHALAHPVFFGAALDDTISLPSIGKKMTERWCTNPKTRIHEFKAGHWVHLERPDEVCEALEAWFRSLGERRDARL
ncbi:hypothetical protein V5O48_018496 [Marasmius crinis-equi]|uniref:AB hydrolase-1 domain-containing protein n=1 Tax=Marasmius crinis-equi TaxID=585013 RepID=A0ABR3EL28_9AGAR